MTLSANWYGFPGLRPHVYVISTRDGKSLELVSYPYYDEKAHVVIHAIAPGQSAETMQTYDINDLELKPMSDALLPWAFVLCVIIAIAISIVVVLGIGYAAINGPGDVRTASERASVQFTISSLRETT